MGVKNIQYPIVVEDRMNDIQHTVADLDIYVELSHTERGTHMSRFIEVLNRYHEDAFINNLEPFLEDIKKSLNADAAFTQIGFRISCTRRRRSAGSSRSCRIIASSRRPPRAITA